MSPSSLDADTLADELRMRLQSTPRRPEKRFRFVPQLSYGRHRGPTPPGTRPAAVTLLLYQHGDHWFIPFTLRPRTLSTHAGQISLPGGAIDPGECDESCALRELEEEIGVSADEVCVLGRLSSIYVYRSGFLVHPFVSVARKTPVFRPNPAEVEELLEIRVDQLFDSSQHGQVWIVRQLLRFESPCIFYGHHRIWGATLKVVGEFLDLSEEVFGGCRPRECSQ